jgi:hypothetical protein
LICESSSQGWVYAWTGQSIVYLSLAAFDTDTIVVARPTKQIPPHLTVEEYPALAAVWDNDDDTIFDTV